MNNDTFFNDLAYRINNGEPELFDELFNSLQHLILYQGNLAKRKSESSGYNIPVEDFISNFNFAVWLSVKDYDYKKSSFMQRFSYYMKMGEAKVYNSYSYYKDKVKKYDCDNNQNLSIDFLALEIKDFSDESIEKINFMNVVKHFENEQPKYGKIVRLLMTESSNLDIAKSLGENTYNERVRMTVMRTRKAFKKFLTVTTCY